MRWTEPNAGEERIVRKFLWWPMCLGGQNRWFEFTHVRQIYERSANDVGFWRWVEFVGQDLPDQEQPQVGDGRLVQKYLWWPVRLKGEVRWLERVSVRQVFERTAEGTEIWRWVEFVDPPARKSRQPIRAEGLVDSPGEEPYREPFRRSPEERFGDDAEFVRVVKTSSALNDGDTIELLVGMGARAIPTLLRMRDSDQASVEMVLKQIDSESSVPALINALCDPNPAIREFAAVLLCREYLKPQSSDATSALARTVRDENPNVRMAALRSLVEIAEAPDTVPILAESLQDPDARVRMKTAHMLRRMGSAAREAVAPLQKALDDEVEGVRTAVSAALNTIQSGAPTSEPPPEYGL